MPRVINLRQPLEITDSRNPSTEKFLRPDLLRNGEFILNSHPWLLVQVQVVRRAGLQAKSVPGNQCGRSLAEVLKPDREPGMAISPEDALEQNLLPVKVDEMSIPNTEGTPVFNPSRNLRNMLNRTEERWRG